MAEAEIQHPNPINSHEPCSKRSAAATESGEPAKAWALASRNEEAAGRAEILKQLH